MIGDLLTRLERLADDGTVQVSNFRTNLHRPPGARGPRLWQVMWQVDARAYNLCTEDAEGLPALLEAACEASS